MARNKYPEQTVAKILDVSYALFCEKGYEKTTIQDIIDKLGMSKGAIYHHYKSKEEILAAVSEHRFLKRNQVFSPAQLDQLNGLEKIRFFISQEFRSQEKQEIDQLAYPFIKSPQFLSMTLDISVKKNAPMISAMIKEGKRDGSIDVDDPDMVAEMFMILVNIWINPQYWQESYEIFTRKLTTLQTMFDAIHLPLIDDALYKTVIDYYHSLYPK